MGVLKGQVGTRRRCCEQLAYIYNGKGVMKNQGAHLNRPGAIRPDLWAVLLVVSSSFFAHLLPYCTWDDTEHGTRNRFVRELGLDFCGNVEARGHPSPWTGARLGWLSQALTR